MSGDLRVFGYGSLLFEPERPDALLDMVPAVWPGVRRAFNKISTGRGCPLSASSVPAVEDFVADGRRLSLVLGTEPGQGITGFVLRYDASVAEEVTRRIHAREGYFADRDSALNDYLPVTVQATLPNGQRIAAVAWQTNPRCRAYVGELPIGEVAAILRAATPDEPGARAQGTAYLEGVRRVLSSAGLRDDALDRLSLAIRALQ